MNRQRGPQKMDALVLRSIRHGESSRIVTLFTRDAGRIAVIAKGARSGKSGSTGSALSPPARVEAMVYFKASRNVQTLGQVASIHRFSRVHADLDRLNHAAAVLELLYRCFADEEPNPTAFDGAVEALTALDEGLVDPRLALWKFQILLLTATGFALNPFECPTCGRSIQVALRNSFQLETGAFGCGECVSDAADNHRLTLSGESLRILRHLANITDESWTHLKPSRIARREVSLMLEKFLKFHNPGLGKLHALEMLDSLERNHLRNP